MKILVTGASGFVGGALVSRLRAMGHTVLSVGRRACQAADYVSCDLAHGLDVSFEPEVVVHAAARSSPWGSRREFALQNIEATRQVLEFCRRKHLPYLVHISTCAVMYANEHQMGMDESVALPKHPINIYAETKRAAEDLVRAYEGQHCILRPRAIFGPGDTVLFPRILRAARAGRLPLIESPTPVEIDLIYIDTFVDYIVRAIERRVEGLYLVTNNQPVELIPFLLKILQALSLPPPSRKIQVSRAMTAAFLIESLYRALPFLGEPPLTRFGVSAFAYSKTFKVTKALRDLGPPSVALDDGVARFVEWERLRTSPK